MFQNGSNQTQFGIHRTGHLSLDSSFKRAFFLKQELTDNVIRASNLSRKQACVVRFVEADAESPMTPRHAHKCLVSVRIQNRFLDSFRLHMGLCNSIPTIEHPVSFFITTQAQASTAVSFFLRFQRSGIPAFAPPFQASRSSIHRTASFFLRFQRSRSSVPVFQLSLPYSSSFV